MEPIRARMQRMTQDLRALEDELLHATSQTSGIAEQERILDEVLDFEMAFDLKKAVDHMRSFLWAYIDMAHRNATSGRSAGVDYAAQGRRLQLVTQMLEALRAERPTFFEGVTKVINDYYPPEAGPP